MSQKDLIMLGIILGIALFFIGAIISNVFTSDESDLLAYKISAVIKLLGLGILTTTMIVGGLTITDIDANLKLLLLLLGLVLLIIYSVASPVLEWRIPGYADEGTSGYDYRPTAGGLPGFDLPIVLVSIGTILFLIRWKWKRKQRNG